jgi:hypothetical protein
MFDGADCFWAGVTSVGAGGAGGMILQGAGGVGGVGGVGGAGGTGGEDDTGCACLLSALDLEGTNLIFLVARFHRRARKFPTGPERWFCFFFFFFFFLLLLS